VAGQVLETQILKVERKITVGRVGETECAADATRHMTPEERLSFLEDLRREAALATGHEYPQRLRRVLEVTKQDWR